MDYNIELQLEWFDDDTWVIRNRISKKDRLCHDQKKQKDKKRNNYLQNNKTENKRLKNMNTFRNINPFRNRVNSRVPTMQKAPPQYSLRTTNVSAKHQLISQLHMHSITHPSLLMHLNVITLI